MLPAYNRMNKEELLAEIQRLRDYSRSELELRRTVHELEVYREETRIQTEQLIETQRQLEESRDRYADLYEFAPLPYLNLDSSGLIRDVNLTGTSFLGQDRTHLQSVPFVQHVYQPDRKIWLEHMRRCRTESGPVISELRVVAANDVVWVQVFTRISRSYDQPIFRTALTDLTQQKQSEDEIRRLNSELEERVRLRTKELEDAISELRQVDKRKDIFLAMLGHELRNPLASIGHGLSLLKNERTPADERRRAVDVMMRQLSNVTKLLNELLDVARVTQGKLTLQKSPNNLADLVRSAIQGAASFLQDRGHQLQVDITEDVLYVDCDAARVEQVITNLLHNAGKYTDPGGRIQVSLAREQHQARLQIMDTGIGMTESELRSVFEIFNQSEFSRDRAEGGLGIGLTLAQNLVQLHGGMIEAFSAGRGKGSTLVVWLPLTRTPEPAMQTKELEKNRSRTFKILVIEDNRDAARLLAKLLELSGHEVQVANDGRSGVEAATAMRPEVTILDIGLPGLDGYAVAREMRRQFQQDILLIAMTGLGRDIDRQRAEQAGFNHHLVKPVLPDEIERILNSQPPKTEFKTTN